MEYTPNGAKPRREGGIRLGITGQKQAVNPYLPNWEYIPDGEPYVFGDRVYVYGSHDEDKGEVFCTGDYVCWSAPVNDLGNWHYEGVIYKKTADPFNTDGHMCLYAPDVTVGPDGRYYLYYVLDKVSVVSVAVCDTPAGEYRFLGYVHYPDGTRLGDKEGDEPQFDPGVLTEGDTTWLFTGFCGRGDKTRHGAMLTQLEADMLTVKAAPVIIAPGCEYSAGTSFAGHAFFEAPSIRKKDGKYYFIYSSEAMRELCYAVADRPEGPYTYGGVLVDNCDIGIDTDKPAEQAMACGANNHGSMVQIGDSWYIFYHRHTAGTWYSRQGCAERLSFRPDGSIVQAELTSCGLNGGPLCDRGEYPAYIACHLHSVKHTVYVEETEPRIVQEAGGDHTESHIRGMSDGCAAGFKYFAMQGVNGVRIRTKGYHNGKMEVRASWNGEILGTIDLVSSNIWKADECRFPAITGTNALYLTYRGGGTVSLKSVELLHEN
ncbi:MAG: family 43 glycosylhydrolase [Lachnospiraceae bacterium]|nr:family 43 glycosylhydrolase [Lachnospiraceae bacterium]